MRFENDMKTIFSYLNSHNLTIYIVANTTIVYTNIKIKNLVPNFI